MPTKASYYVGVGRRKEATAQARLSSGRGNLTVNSQPADQYFGHPMLVERLRYPLSVIGKESAYDISLKVRGGGKSGQADAAKLAIAKAIVGMSEDLRPTLKKAGLLMRDARIKERKKPGLKRARKAPQFTKR